MNEALKTLTQPSDPFLRKPIIWILHKLMDLKCSANAKISNIRDNEYFDAIGITIFQRSIYDISSSFKLYKDDKIIYKIDIFIQDSSDQYYSIVVRIHDSDNYLIEDIGGTSNFCFNNFDNQILVSKMFEVLIDFINSDHVIEEKPEHTYILSD